MSSLRTLVGVAAFSLLGPAGLMLLGPARVCGQSASAKAAGPETSTAPGFSIESEMLTYRALESNSDAIACEVASLLSGVPRHFAQFSPGSRCDITAGASDMKVLILPFDNEVVSDFAMWRSDMETMDEMVASASTLVTISGGVCSIGGETQGTGKTSQRSATPGGLAAEVSPEVAAVSSILGLLGSDYSTSPVGGTIEDQAFMDDVSRDLRILNVNVVSPSVYAPGALTPLNAKKSPYLTERSKLRDYHDCLASKKGASDPSVINIETFLKSLSDSLPADSSAQSPGNGAASNGNTPGKGAANSKSGSTGSQPSSHLAAVLSADALASMLGVGPDGKLSDAASFHLLLLKALESGGEVSRLTNVLGTRISYSGGSVATFALFNLDGQVECSGNVYDYAGPVPAKNFGKKLRAFAPDPDAQVIFKRGNCPGLTMRSQPANHP